MHIRRTDHVKAIAHSPIENYFRKMEEELAAHPDTIFYVASDSDEVKEQMKARWGNTVVMQNLVQGRNTTLGMKDAVVELFTLASCSKLLGSRYSTYSLMASRLYDIPFVGCDSDQ